MHLVQVAQRATDLERAAAFYGDLLEQQPVATLGPAGTDEWMAFIADSEGNTVGLVSHLARSDSAS